ncbi:hypothetical protein [Ureibacillus thermosphaericus]
MAEDSEEWEFFLETLWEFQCLKTRSELTEDIKKTFYEECQGITSVAVNLFILAQERVLFDEANEDEKITPRVIKKTAREDMKIIQSMLNALRKNDLKAMYKYEDIMINLDDLMINHKKNLEYEGKIREAMKERKNTLEYKRQDMIESLNVEIMALGIFDALTSNDNRKLVIKNVERNPIDVDHNILKSEIIQEAIELNKQQITKNTSNFKQKGLTPLIDIRNRASQKNQHSYELLYESGYIKNPLKDIY